MYIPNPLEFPEIQDGLAQIGDRGPKFHFRGMCRSLFDLADNLEISVGS
jgi:hypothetical protein